MSKNATKRRKAMSNPQFDNLPKGPVTGRTSSAEAPPELVALRGYVPKLHNALRDAHKQRDQASDTAERLVQEVESFTQREQRLTVNAKSNLWLGMATGLVVGGVFAALALNFG